MKTVEKLDKYFSSSLEHPMWQNYMEHAIRDFEFREGTQWTSDEVTELEKRGQPATVENEIKPIVDRILGQYKKQKTRIIYRGRNLPDESLNNLLSDVMLYIQQNNGYEFEEGDMFDDGSVSGMGVIDTYVEFDDLLQPEIRIRHEDCLNVFPDPDARHYDWNKDAKFICRAKWMPLEEAYALYPDHKKELKVYANVDPVQNSTGTFKKENYVDSKMERVRPVETWYKEYTNRSIAYTENGAVDVTDLKKKEIAQLKESGAQILARVDVRMRVAVHCGSVLLEDKESPHDHNFFPFIPFFSYRKKDGEPYSVVRLLIDPQMEINKRRSKALHLLNTNQAVYEKGAILDKDTLQTELAKPDGQIEFQKGRKFELVKNIEVANSQMGLLQESKMAMNRISGYNAEHYPEIRSGVGLQRKQMIADLLLLPVFDNLRRTRKILGAVVLELIKQYYTTEKLFYITDDANQSRQVGMGLQQIQLARKFQYDVIIEEMPDTTTVQDEQFRMITELLQSIKLPPQVYTALLPVMLQMSQIRNKDEVLKQFEAMSKPAPEQPSISLSLTWDTLEPEMKAKMAQVMGIQMQGEQQVPEGMPLG